MAYKQTNAYNYKSKSISHKMERNQLLVGHEWAADACLSLNDDSG